MRRRFNKGGAHPSPNRSAMFSKKVTKQPEQSVVIAEEAEAVKVMEKRSCAHFDKYVDLDKLLKNIKSCEQIKCGECKEGLHVKKRSEGKVNSGKNKFSFSCIKAIWLCLECGHYICGGVGLPTKSQSHVMRHIRLTRHRLVIQCENPRLRWCYACQSLLPFEKEENGEKKDLLVEAVKLIKERYSNTDSASTETEDSYSRSGNSIFGDIRLQGSAESNGLEARDGYAVRGLVNLGNTCFFNSVLQNLLSLNQLRDHLLKEDLCCAGPLVSSLKTLFAKTTFEAGLFRSVINPRAFFGSVCSKAPQFWGYQQHDSHELLRCLLDSLSMEESSLRKKLDVSYDSDDSSSHQNPTLVDSIFGGEISSTISCLECGHSSKVYEPFLDLSLPVPSKKPPPKKQQTLSQAKKGETPTKKVLVTQADNEEVENFWWDTFGIEVSNEIDLVSQGDIRDTASATQSEVVDQTFVDNTETLIHDNDGSAKPETVPDQEDARAMQSNKDTASSEISAEIGEARVCGYPYLRQCSSSANSCADEDLPLLVADSQVLYIPYKDDISYGDKTVAEGKGEASSSYVSGQHEQTVDIVDSSGFLEKPDASPSSLMSGYHEQAVDNVDLSGFLDKPDVSCNEETVRGCEGEVPSSLVSGHHELTVDNVDLSGFLDNPDVSCNEETVRECEGEVPSSLVSGQHEQAGDKVDLSGFLDKPDVSCNEETVRECEAEVPSSLVSGHHEQTIDHHDFNWLFDEPEISEGPFFGPPSKDEVSEAGFMAFSSNTDADAEVLDDSDSPMSVDRCLAQFTKPEILSEDNAWHCENCSSNLKLQRLSEKINSKEGWDNGWVNEIGAISASYEYKDDPLNQSFIDLENWETIDDSEEVIVKRPATKRVLVNKAPPVLTIHLKRFCQDARGKLSKIRGHVDFKEFIDLGIYMDMDSRWIEEDQPVYMLTGLVEHLGTMRRGHYVAYVRGDGKERRNSPDSSIWYRASDSHVRQVSFEEVLRSEAYILFYQRI